MPSGKGLSKFIAGFIRNLLLTTPGDIIVRGATVPERFAAGAVGTIIKGQGAGVVPAWGQVGGVTTQGDLIVRGAAVPERLAAGAVGTVIKGLGAGVIPAYQVLKEITSPFTLCPYDFIPQKHTVSYQFGTSQLYNMDAGFAQQTFFAPIYLPNGAVMSSLRLFGYRNDAASTITATLYRSDFEGTTLTLGTASLPNTTGYHSAFDYSIDNPIINNNGMCYYVGVLINNNDSTGDCRLTGIHIAWS